MKIKIYKKILLALFLVIILLLPLKTKAAVSLPRLLPDCDKTVYQVKKGGPVTAIIDGQKSSGCCVYPSDYEKNPVAYGDITGVYINRRCGFNDFVQLLANLFEFGLASLAVVVLFFFIWGGFGFIIAGGRAEKIQEAKNTLKGAFIGMIIVLVAWMLVNFYVFAFTGDIQGKIFGKFWWGAADCHDTYKKSCTKNNLHEGCGGEPGSPTDRYIKDLQNRLNSFKDCNCGPVDGCFGNQTLECVVNFQIFNNVNYKELGVVDEETWKAINQGGQCTEQEIEIPDISLPGEEKFCCVPNPGYEDMWGCFEVKNRRNCDSMYNFHTEEGSCLLYPDQCEQGCCEPITDLSRACYSTKGGCLPGEQFSNSLCEHVSGCLFYVCMGGAANNCYAQRGGCNAGDNSVYTTTSEDGALGQILSIDQCNMGTCAVPQPPDVEGNILYNCAWISRNTCNQYMGEFFYDLTYTIGGEVGGPGRTGVICSGEFYLL